MTEKCNMKCIYCNIDKSDKYIPNINSFLKFKKEYLDILDQYTLDLFGGEPLLFTDFIKSVIKELENDDKCIKICIPTNCTIFNEDVKYIMNHDKIIISGSYDGILQSANRGDQKLFLKELEIKKVHCMITGNNLSRLSNILIDQHNFFKEKNIIVNMEIVRDIGSFSKEQSNIFINNYKEYIKYILPEIAACQEIDKLPILFTKYFNQFMMGLKGQYKGCQAGTKNNAYIEKDDRYISCLRFNRTNDEEKYLNNLDKYIFKCQTCSIKTMCGYGCIYEIIQNNGPIEELCLIYKGIFKIIQEYIIKEKEIFKNFINIYYKKRK